MKYYVVSFCGDSVPIKQYDITPLSWILSKEKTLFPLYERTKLEQLVEAVKQPTPKKDFQQYDIKILHATDDFDWALEVVRRLDSTDDYIDDIIKQMDAEKEAERKRPRRTWAPSAKAVERAALPTTDESVTECSEWEEIEDRQPKRRRSSWKKNMAAIYNYCDSTEVVLSLRGRGAEQHLSDDRIRSYGVRMLQRMAEDAAKLQDAEDATGHVSKQQSTTVAAIPQEAPVSAQETTVPAQEAVVPAQKAVVPVKQTTLAVEEAPAPKRKALVVPAQKAVVPANQTPMPVEEAPAPIPKAPVVPAQKAAVPVKEAPLPLEEAPAPVRKAPVVVSQRPGPSSRGNGNAVPVRVESEWNGEEEDSSSDIEISQYTTQQQSDARTERAGRTPGALKRAVHEMAKEAKSKKKRLEFEKVHALPEMALPDFPSLEGNEENVREEVPLPEDTVSQDLSRIVSGQFEERGSAELDTAFDEGTPMSTQQTSTASCSGSKESERQILKYLVSIHSKVHELTKEVRELKKRNAMSQESGSASPASSQDDTKTRIPCTSREQLQALESNLDCFPHAFRELVQILTITGQDCTVGKTVGCFVSQAIDRVVEKRLLANMSWQGTATKWPFNVYENVVDAVKKAAQASFAKEGQATDEIVLQKIKKKIGNNSYWHGRSERMSASPATPKARRKTTD